MDSNRMIEWGLNFYSRSPEFCYVVAGILLVLLLWKPLKVLKTALLLSILAAIIAISFYLIDSMDVGRKIKKDAIHRTEKALEK